MTLDATAYLHHLDGMDLSEAEKIEFIRTLWLIAQCFVDDAYSRRGEGEKPHVSSLKSGFEAAGVIKLDDVREARAIPANDNAESQGKKGAA